MERGVMSKLTDETKCQQCGNKTEEEEHPCPYLQELDGDEEPHCNCCESCINDCHLSI